MSDHHHPTTRFGDFELDVAGYELRRRGRPLRLERQPMELLLLLVARRGELVSRSDIVARLWGDGVFVDVETGVNTAVSKVRQALRDSAEAPLFVETVQGKGYRFIAPVEVLDKPGSEPARLKLAVLPFENLGGGPEREYLADGFTEEAIIALGQIDPEHLLVVGRTSVTGYKRTTKSLSAIGQELGATYLLESSIRAEGERWRVTCKLIRVPDQVHIWSQSYDSEPGSMLEFQRELSTVIAEQIKLRLSPRRLAALERRRTLNAEAFDLYLRGRHYWNRLTPQTSRRAIEYYERATRLDPEYALAWSGLADAYAAGPISGDVPALDVWRPARDAATRAVAIGPELAEANTSLGFVNYWLNWDWPAAEAAYRRAIELDSSYPLAHRMLGVVLAFMNRPTEAAAAMRRARELDPLYPMHQALSSHVAFLARDHATGLQFGKQCTVVGPDFWIGYFHLAQVYEQLGESRLALEALSHAELCSGGNSKLISLRGYIFARQDRHAEAREVLATLASVAQERFVPPYALALVHAGLDERDAALTWLERAYQARDVHLVFLPVDPKWDHFRVEPRFLALLQRCGFGRSLSGS